MSYRVVLAVGNPPALFIPSFGDTPLGWSLGVIVLLGPILFNLFSWQRRRGHWRYFFAQWRTTGFWLLWNGSLLAAGGIFGLTGLTPAWEGRWSEWYLAAFTDVGADRAGLAWLHHLQRQYLFMLQLTTAVLFIGGATAVVSGLAQLSRRMAKFRGEPDAWLVTSPESQKVPAVRRSRLR